MKHLISFLFTILQMAHGMDFNNCGENVFRKNIRKAGGWEGGVMMTIVASSTSSAQFTSSWGDCSLVAKNMNIQKHFFSQVWEPLQIDIARGSGEFSDALAEISKCNNLGKNELKKELQKNYSTIYGDDNSFDVDKTYLKILNVMKSDKIIWNNCDLNS